MSTEYVEKRDHGDWVAGSRVSLDSVVYAFLNGQPAESIALSFPVLNLEQVVLALADERGTPRNSPHGRITGPPACA